MEQKTQIKGNIHYVGVNDRTKPLFEAIWPLPQGISYNSYLIADEKVALVDTVDACYFETFLDKVRTILGDRPIDYLIVNHMEPDHSGSISLIRHYYPQITLVGNKQTLAMLEGFYGLSGSTLAVADGTTLPLGRHHLEFYLTPMVHWPETMMTYDRTEGVLFSGDAFGTFGALDGGFLDTRICIEKYHSEMLRYYSSVVGKYGLPVQRSLQKLAPLAISAICSTHGPVWTEGASGVIAQYDRLSRYQGENGVTIAYGSMYGNTERMAETIAEELSFLGVRHIALHNVSKTDASYILSDIFRYNGLILGCPTYNGTVFPAMEALLSKILNREIKNRCLGYFGSFTWAGAAVKGLGEFAEKSRFEIVGTPVEMKQGFKSSAREQCEALAQAMAARLAQDK